MNNNLSAELKVKLLEAQYALANAQKEQAEKQTELAEASALLQAAMNAQKQMPFLQRAFADCRKKVVEMESLLQKAKQEIATTAGISVEEL